MAGPVELLATGQVSKGLGAILLVIFGIIQAVVAIAGYVVGADFSRRMPGNADPAAGRSGRGSATWMVRPVGRGHAGWICRPARDAARISSARCSATLVAGSERGRHRTAGRRPARGPP